MAHTWAENHVTTRNSAHRDHCRGPGIPDDTDSETQHYMHDGRWPGIDHHDSWPSAFFFAQTFCANSYFVQQLLQFGKLGFAAEKTNII